MYIHACIHVYYYILYICTHCLTGTIPDGNDLRWHSAEKQKRLIHTAPVLAPSSNKQSSQSESNTSHYTHGKMHGNSYAEVDFICNFARLSIYLYLCMYVCMLVCIEKPVVYGCMFMYGSMCLCYSWISWIASSMLRCDHSRSRRQTRGDG